MIGRRGFLAGLGVLAASRRWAHAQTSIAPAAALIAAARAQVGVTLAYDPAYAQLAFPGGDVPRRRGVCTDVIIRAYRDAFGLDLQLLVNRDMHAAFADYPRRWGLTHPDANIDHRRVDNLRVYLNRKGAAQPFDNPVDFCPGDLVTLRLPGNLPHIGIVSDARGEQGLPLLIHNIGQGAREEAALHLFPLTGRYRWLPGEGGEQVGLIMP